jgi:predicted dehydrogenase
MSPPRKRIRYAVVGLGHIAQAAVLPAFANARSRAELAALVSDDPEKLRKLSRKYGLKHSFSYDEYDACLESGEIDAVYIALPNHLHCEYTVRAARKGIHVLCEKPMAPTSSECAEMNRAARESRIRLMIAYRLHFEEANMKAADIVQSGKLGDPRLFHSIFTMQVKEGDIRVRRETGGGTLHDIGIYCINAARYLLRREPVEAFARSFRKDTKRFAEVDEMTTSFLAFPGEVSAAFTTSFGAADSGAYDVVGTEGTLRVDPAYEYAGELRHILTVKGKTRERTFRKRDQFAPELIYFADCILEGRDPEPSGEEGEADVRIIEALYRSAETGRPVRIEPSRTGPHPGPRQVMRRRAVREPDLVNTSSPHPDE